MNKEDIDENPSLNLDKPHLGKAGEHLTAGKLLLNGFNVYFSALDEGIDLVASKEDYFYKIQVKTCQDIEEYDSGNYAANVNLSTLSKHDPAKTYVVLVIHYLNTQISLDNAGNHNVYDQAFIVIPAAKIFELAQSTSGQKTLRIKSNLVANHGGEWLFKLRLNKQDLILDDYLDGFAEIATRG